MNDYRAPLQDAEFVYFTLLDAKSHLARLDSANDVDPETLKAVIRHFAEFSEESIAPLAKRADAQGCKFNDGLVSVPDGFKEAYESFRRDGWRGLAVDPKFGGQGIPKSVATITGEFAGSSAMSWHLFQVACEGAMATLGDHGTESQQREFLRPIVDGRWFATMALTEPHCGSDLGQIKCIARETEDGSYLLSGTKIFISCGEHDLGENIIHIVLARTPEAPSGTRGLSLFIVPKMLSQEDGSIGVNNSVTCASIEEKMGLHGSPTCELLFDQAVAYRLGPIHEGLKTMFTFMNDARLATANQSLSHMEYGLQKSLRYSRERRSMRAPSGPVDVSAPADPIIVHPDVRRMLMTQKALTEGARVMVYWMAQLVDLESSANKDEAKAHAHLLEALTPIGKGFISEVAQESCYLSVQCFGGHGYVRDWGVERNSRDARIATIWEGTTGIQALDLLGRKVLGDPKGVHILVEKVRDLAETGKGSIRCHAWAQQLAAKSSEWESLIQYLRDEGRSDPEHVGSSSYPFLMYSGYVLLAYIWLRMAMLADAAVTDTDNPSYDFYAAKLATAEFYFEHLLPRAAAFLAAARANPRTIMGLSSDQLGPQ